MKQNNGLKLLLCLALWLALAAPTNATFSIVAVDTVTGEVGGAGASCIAGAAIINDIIESIGAVHTQAWYHETNQDNAHDLLAAGLTPDSIIAWLVANDVQSFSALRQYGVVTLAGPGASAGFTGASTDDWKGHIAGPGYAIQGNILLSQQIVDTMEFAFLNTPGPLEYKLMAALEAAKVPGADTRCLAYNKSSISAFIKVVRPGDNGRPYLDEVVHTTPSSTDPIDVLRVQFDAWETLKHADADASTITVAPVLLQAIGVDTAWITITPRNSDGVAPINGVDAVLVDNTGDGAVDPVAGDNGDGTYSAYIVAPTAPGVDTIVVSVEAGGELVALSLRPVIDYFKCGDMDNNGDGPDIADLIYMVTYMFQGGPESLFMESCDVDGNGTSVPDIADLIYIVTYMFQDGPALQCL